MGSETGVTTHQYLTPLLQLVFCALSFRQITGVAALTATVIRRLRAFHCIQLTITHTTKQVPLCTCLAAFPSTVRPLTNIWPRVGELTSYHVFYYCYFAPSQGQRESLLSLIVLILSLLFLFRVCRDKYCNLVVQNLHHTAIISLIFLHSRAYTESCLFFIFRESFPRY